MFIDTHCHVLSEYYDNINEVVNQCKKNNVCRIIVNGCDINSNKEVLELVSKYDIIYGAIGFHPTELDDFNDEYFEFLENNISNPKIVAIGFKYSIFSQTILIITVIGTAKIIPTNPQINPQRLKLTKMTKGDNPNSLPSILGSIIFPNVKLIKVMPKNTIHTFPYCG